MQKTPCYDMEAARKALRAVREYLAGCDMFNLDETAVEETNRLVIAKVPLKRQMLVQQVADRIIQLARTQNLFRCHSKRRDRIMATGYSIPWQDEMFSFCLDSHQFGIIENVTFTCYTTISDMHALLCKEMAILDSPDMEVDYRQPANKFYANFM